MSEENKELNEQNVYISFQDKLKAPIAQLWANHKWFLIGFGILILVIKFQDVIIDVLVNSSKRLVNDSKVQDNKLKNEENAANNQANQLIDESNQLGQNKPKVDEDWNSKK